MSFKILERKTLRTQPPNNHEPSLMLTDVLSLTNKYSSVIILIIVIRKITFNLQGSTILNIYI